MTNRVNWTYLKVPAPAQGERHVKWRRRLADGFANQQVVML
jgi:hypothetical protein